MLMQARRSGPIRQCKPERNYMNPENNTTNKSKTVLIVIIAIVIAIGAILGIAVMISKNGPETRYASMMNLGNSYLDVTDPATIPSGDLELAIEQFEAAREMMPERPEAYMALARVYSIRMKINKLVGLYESAEGNLSSDDLEELEDYIFDVVENTIEYAVDNGKESAAFELADKLEEINEDRAQEIRDEYFMAIPWYNDIYGDKPEDDEPQDEEPAADTPEKPDVSRETGYEEGNLIPDFTFYDEDGKYHSISEFRGQAVYINFFTTWCTYCFYELPDMEDVNDKYSDDAVFIMIDLQEGPELGTQYAEDYDVTIPIYYVDSWKIEGLEINAVPLSIVIDANGVVYGNCLGQASYDWMDDTVNDAIDSAK